MWNFLLEGPGRGEIEYRCYRDKGRLFLAPKQSRFGPWVEGDKGQRYELPIAFRAKSLPLSTLTEYSELVVTREALDAFLTDARQKASQEVSQKADTRPLNEQERHTFLVIMAALLEEAKIDVSHPYKAADVIIQRMALMESLDAPLSNETIAQKLKLVQDVIQKRS